MTACSVCIFAMHLPSSEFELQDVTFAQLLQIGWNITYRLRATNEPDWVNHEANKILRKT